VVAGARQTREDRDRMAFLRVFVAPLFTPLTLGFAILAAGMVLLWTAPRQAHGRALASIGLVWMWLASNWFIANAVLWRMETRYRPLEPVYRTGPAGDPQNAAAPGQQGETDAGQAVPSGSSCPLRAGAPLAQRLSTPVPWIVVLGTGYAPTWGARPQNSEVSHAFLARFTEAVRLWRLMPTARLAVCVTGDMADDRAKQDLVAQLLGICGLTPEFVADAGGVHTSAADSTRVPVFVISSPQNTVGEAKAVAQLVRGCCAVVVTSAAHMPRAMAAFRAQGVEAIAAPCDYITGLWGTGWLARLLPSAQGVDGIDALWYELTGWVRGTLAGEL
jgi:uncharacterized SAM-binding protein YcdF (DUF218 family)